MRLLQRDLKPVTLIKASGEIIDGIKVNLQSKEEKMLTTAFDVPFEEGDVIQRQLQNGITENYQIIQINQSPNVINMDIKKITKLNVYNAGILEQSTVKDKLVDLIKLGEEVTVKEKVAPTAGLSVPDIISGSTYENWMNEIQILNERYLISHPLYGSIKKICDNRKKTLAQCNSLLNKLKAIDADKEFWENLNTGQEVQRTMKNKVFIVHGHDDAAKQEMARVLENAGFKAIILHEQASAGMTIIEKIESHTDVDYAVVLYTACDLGRDKDVPIESEKYRARQNVVFEHGFLMGKLGRDHVTALVKGDIEKPGDISGIVYTEMDSAGAWKMELAKNMRAIGIDIDMNKFI